MVHVLSVLFAVFVASAVSADFVVSVGPACIFAELNSPEPISTRSIAPRDCRFRLIRGARSTAPGNCQVMRLESASTRSTAPGDDQRKALACSRGIATDKFHRA